MTDVLKLAEEALQGLLDIGKRDLTNQKYDGYFEMQSDALTAIRAARVEWGWLELPKDEVVLVNVFMGTLDDDGEWIYSFARKMLSCDAMILGYTHFYRPQLPPPPAREEVGNG